MHGGMFDGAIRMMKWLAVIALVAAFVLGAWIF